MDSVMRGRGRLKTERQQVLNKAAQQRYRERKKAKAQELEQTVACLEEKVVELSALTSEKEALQVRPLHAACHFHCLSIASHNAPVPRVMCGTQ